MDVLYIPQLDEGDAGESPTAGRYRLLKRVPEEGCVALTDRAVTRIEVTATDPLKLTVPPLVKGAVRDFFVRLVITADEIPEVTFAPPVAGPSGALTGGGYSPAGETLSFEDVDEDVFKCEVGVNVFAFTETDQGIFIVNRKQVDIDQEVEFDPCGNAPERSGGDLAEGDREAARQGARELEPFTLVFKLGAPYGELPKPTMAGHTFLGWFTESEGGVEISSTDRCKTGVTKVYAHWEVYVDPFVDAICPAKNLTFFSESASPWRIDTGTYSTAPGSARSGVISDNGSTSLTTTVQGKGTLSFKWKVSSEGYYDKLHLFIDGQEIVSDFSGTRGWETYTRTITADGSHTVEWRYTKDGSVSSGSDCGWVDDVVWTPEG